jgi:hypothetical protein
VPKFHPYFVLGHELAQHADPPAVGRRPARAYTDGAFGESEYAARLAETDARIRAAQLASLPSLEEAAALFSDLGTL